MSSNRNLIRAARFVAALGLLTLINCLLHASLLHLPYYWDEAGYFIPAARDFFLTGDPIPRSVVSNAHPPLVFLWLALNWKIFGFSPVVTRVAMLVVSSFGLLSVFRFGEILQDRITGCAAVICLGLYPVYFAQGSLAQLDLPAAVLTWWGLSDYLEEKIKRCAVWCSLAVLTKEIAVVAPLALILFEAVFVVGRKGRRLPDCLFLLAPVAVLALWYFYHGARTGMPFGNPEFLRYNVVETQSVRRAGAALLIQMFHAFAFFNLWLLSVPAFLLWVFRRPAPVFMPRVRPLLVCSIAYVAALSSVGGAALARYLLPVAGLVVVMSTAILRARLRQGVWAGAIAITAAIFVASLHWYPPYHFAWDDNLAYADFVRLHQAAGRFLETNPGTEPISTAWPATDELSRPFLGYTKRPLAVTSGLDAALKTRFVFTARYEPQSSGFRPGNYLRHFLFWNNARSQFFESKVQTDVQGDAGDVIWEQHRGFLDGKISKRGRIWYPIKQP